MGKLRSFLQKNNRLLNYWKNEKILAAFCYLALFTLFFAPTLMNSKLPYNSDYLLGIAPWTTIQPDGSVVNKVLSDSVDAAFPNRSFFNSSLRKGELPLWNPYISTGTPFASLLFTDTFSLANLTSLIAGVMWGRLFYYVIKLFILAYFTYLFLRQLGLSLPASFFGGTAAAFSSYVIAYLAMHVVDAVVFLPALLFWGEQFYSTRSPRSYFAAAFIVALMLLSGFPAITFYALLLAAVYFLFRTLLDLANHQSFITRLNTLSRISTIFLVGILLSLVSLLPTAEFFQQTDVSYRMGRGTLVLPQMFLWRLLVNDICGSPIDRTWFCTYNFNETAIYSGILPILFLPLAALHRKRRQTAVFFMISSLAIILISFGIGPWGPILDRLPIANINANYRSIALLPVTLSVSGAIGFDAVMGLSGRKKVLALTLLTSLLMAALVLIFPATSDLLFIDNQALVSGQVQMTALLILLGGMLIALLILVKKHILRLITAVVLILFSFGDLAVRLYDYNGASSPTSFFPETPGIDFLQENLANYERLVPLDLVLIPSSPLYYSLNTLFGHWWTNPHYKATASLIDPHLFSGGRMTQPLFSTASIDYDSDLLELYRVRYLVTRGNEPLLSQVSAGSQKEYNDVILAAGKTIGQSLTVSREASIERITLRMSVTDPGPLPVDFRLSVDGEDKVNFEGLLQPLEGQKWYELVFPETPVSVGQAVHFEFTLINPPSDVVVHSVDFNIYKQGDLLIDRKKVTGDLAFSIIDFDPSFEDKYRLVYENEIKIYENQDLTGSLPVVTNSRLVDEENCLAEMASIDLSSTALVERQVDFGASEKVLTTQGKALITSYQNNELKISVDTPARSIVVLSDTWYPGWKASVDGVDTDILKVNCNMRGVVVDAGNHTIEMRYRPASVVIGIVVSASTLIGLVIWVFVSDRIQRKRTQLVSEQSAQKIFV